MERIKAYKFCPICGNPLVHFDFEGKDHLKCSECRFHFFINPGPCASALIFENDKILLAKRANEPYKDTWEVPGGFIEKGETSETALVREMKEELGIEILNLKYFTSKPNKYKFGEITYDLILSYFTCNFTGEVKPNDEVVDWGFFDLNNLPEIGFPCHQKALELLREKTKIQA